MKKRIYRRSLRLESLESRTVFAADAAFQHNFLFPEDCDGSGDVTPLDALTLVNAINVRESMANHDAADLRIDVRMLDVNADGQLSPIDALVVINHLNRANGTSDQPTSGVPTVDRIVRIQQAIDNGQLPRQFDIETARELLATLRAGGRPEAGDRFFEGRLCPAELLERILNERATLDLTLPLPDRDPTNRITEYLQRFEERLDEAGIDQSVISTIVQEIRTGIENGTPLTLSQIKERLTELGVDLGELFPVRSGNSDGGNPNPEIETRLREWVNRLQAAGVDAEVVTTIVSEIRTSIEAGHPLTLNQIKARLTELGVDLSTVFPNIPLPNSHPSNPTPRVELVTRILQRANVPQPTIEIVRNAMQAANDAGHPLRVREILEILQQNNVRLPTFLVRLLS